jgi:hypothetical protein
MTTEELLTQLARPIYLWRMGRAKKNFGGKRGEVAKEQESKALSEAEDLLEKWAKGRDETGTW